jgi:hypothetical protein
MDLSEKAFGLTAEAMGYMSDALTAAGHVDVVALRQANSDLDEVNPKMHALTTPMKSAVSECRAKE